MTADKKFKRLVRRRAAKTGESYAAARRQLRRTSGSPTMATPTVQNPRIALIGALGSGKGSLVREIARQSGAEQLPPGDLLREAARAGEVSREVAAFINRGVRVPDSVLLAVMGRAVLAAAATGYLLDGFPETRHQAVALHALCGDSETSPTMLVVADSNDEARLLERYRSLLPAMSSEDHGTRLAWFRTQAEDVVEFYDSLGHPTLRVDVTATDDAAEHAARQVLQRLDAASADRST